MSEFMLRVPQGANKTKTIKGRGRSSGGGKTAGRGHKGQKARSGGGVRIGFEGGQMPLYRRVASRGFSNHPFKIKYVAINLAALERAYADGDRIDLETLIAGGLVKKHEKLVKILGKGELTKKLIVSVPAVSASARAKIEKAGGNVTLSAASSDTGK